MPGMERFPLNSRDDAQRFEALLKAHLDATCTVGVMHFSLGRAWDVAALHPAKGKLFFGVLDLTITIGLVQQDSNDFAGLVNQIKDESLDGQVAFNRRFELHGLANAFVLRYRSAWDKLMGLMVLLSVPGDYERYVSSKSRKKAFNTIMEKKLSAGALSKPIGELLARFDDSFRTAEAHGAGVLRKTTFTWDDLETSPYTELLGFWNGLNRVAGEVGRLVNDAPLEPEAYIPV